MLYGLTLVTRLPFHDWVEVINGNVFAKYQILFGIPTSPINSRGDSRFASSQWETSLQSNAVSHWLGANLESALSSKRCRPKWSCSLHIYMISFCCTSPQTCGGWPLVPDMQKRPVIRLSRSKQNAVPLTWIGVPLANPISMSLQSVDRAWTRSCFRWCF